jgi:biopolymer transport protein ExbD
VCPKLWRTYGYELSIGYIWRWSDLVERSIFIALALMLGYNVFVVSRFFHRYYLARRESRALVPDSGVVSQPGQKQLVAELSRGVGTLKSIASAAPFLGLAGTCYGILGGFYGLGVRAHGGIGSIVGDVAGTLVTAVAGLIVATPAAVSHNLLRTLLEKIVQTRSNPHFQATSRSYGFAQTLPLQKRFSGFPAFALIGAPILALLIPMFALMLRSRVPVGLPVHLLRIGATDHDFSPTVVSVIGAKANGLSRVYVNSKETSWEELRSTIRTQLEVRPRWIVYVQADSDASWRDAVYVIDVARGLHAEVVLLTTTPEIGSDRSPKAKTKKVSDQ